MSKTVDAPNINNLSLTTRYIYSHNPKHLKVAKKPTKNELDKMYSKDYLAFKSIGLLLYLKRLINKSRAKTLKKYIYGKTILEVGSAKGEFLDEAVLYSPKSIVGIEYSKSATTKTNLLHKIKLHNTSFENYKTKEKFDSIFMFHVIEHFLDVDKAFLKCKSLLNKKGMLIMETPNLDSLDAYIFGKYWTNISAPYHINVFSYESLKGTAKLNGFKIIDVYSARFPNSFSIQFLFIPKYLRFLLLPLLVPVFIITYFISSYFNKSGVMTVVAQKDDR